MNWTHRLSGAVAMAAISLCVLGAAPRYVSSENVLGPLVRIFDSLSPWILVVAAGFAIITIALGLRRLGLVLTILCFGSVGQLVWEHRALSLPADPDRTADLRVLFFNVLGENAAFADRIVTDVLAADPDIVIFAEGDAMYPALRRLGSHYRQLTPCELDDCGLIGFVRLETKRHWRLDLSNVFQDRYLVIELDQPDTVPVFIVANHLTKPWFSGFAETEIERLGAQYDWLNGQVAVVGDFNMAPWSYPMRALLAGTGMKALRAPPATWPARLGRFGVPIDQVLVHGGMRVVSAQPFGGHLNSNHRGLLVDLALDN